MSEPVEHCPYIQQWMAARYEEALSSLKSVASQPGRRLELLGQVAQIIGLTLNRWVGLYEVDYHAYLLRLVAAYGGPPERSTFSFDEDAFNSHAVWSGDFALR